MKVIGRIIGSLLKWATIYTFVRGIYATLGDVRKARKAGKAEK